MNKLLTTIYAIALAFTALGAATTASAQSAKIVPDAKAGEQKVAMCVGCHSIIGYQASFPEIHKVPMIAGQGAGYITAALNEYKKGDRKHPTMRAIADTLTEQDIANVAAYYSQLGAEAGKEASTIAVSKKPTSIQQALLDKGKCVACHGDNFSKPLDPSYPMIAGQHADYLYVALKSYKIEKNPQVGRSNGVMGAVAKQFTNSELKELAGYVGSLDGHLKTVPESRFVRN